MLKKDFILKNYLKYNLQELTDLYNKTFNTDISKESMSVYKSRLGIKGESPKKDFLIKHYSGVSTRELTKMYNETFNTNVSENTINRYKSIYGLKNELPVGSESIHKDRVGRVRVKIKVNPNETTKYNKSGRTMVDKRIVEYLRYNPDETIESLSDYVIMHLDNNPLNFDKDNLVKVKKNIFLLLLNNKMLYEDKDLNRTALLIANNMFVLNKYKNGGIIV